MGQLGGLSRLEALTAVAVCEVGRAGLAALARSVDGLALHLTSLELRLPQRPAAGGGELSQLLHCLGRLASLRSLTLHEGRLSALADVLPRLSALTKLALPGRAGIKHASDLEALAAAPALLDFEFERWHHDIPQSGPAAVVRGVRKLSCLSGFDDLAALQRVFPCVEDLTVFGDDSVPLPMPAALLHGRPLWRGLRRVELTLCKRDARGDEPALEIPDGALLPVLARLGALGGQLEELSLSGDVITVLGAADLRGVLQASPLLAALTLSSLQLAHGALATCTPHTGLRTLTLEHEPPAGAAYLAFLLDIGRAFPLLRQLLTEDCERAVRTWAGQLDALFGGAPAEVERFDDFSFPARSGLLRAVRGALRRQAAAPFAAAAAAEAASSGL